MLASRYCKLLSGHTATGAFLRERIRKISFSASLAITSLSSAGLWRCKGKNCGEAPEAVRVGAPTASRDWDAI